MLRCRLEAETGADGMGALERRCCAVRVIQCKTDVGTLLLAQRYVDRGTGADAAVGGGGVAVPQALLEDIAGTELDDVEEAVLEAEGEVVAQEGVGGEATSNGEALVPLLEEEVVRETDVEAGGKLHLGSAGLDGEVVVGVVDHGQRMTGAAELHRGAPVFEADAELELVVLTRDILDTGIDGETGTGDVVGALGGQLEDDTAMDGVGEAVGIGHVDVHVAGREGAVGTGLGAVIGGDRKVAEADSHDVDTKDTRLEDADAETEGVDGSATIETRLATIEDGVGVGNLDVIDECQTSGIVEHGVDATHAGDVDTAPAGAACPRVDEKLGGTCSSATLIVACHGRLGRHGRQYHNYCKYF